MALADSKKSFPNLGKHFVQLAKNGDVQKLKAEVDDVASIICAVDGCGWTMLHFAADAGRLEMAEFLLDSGADLDARNGYGSTPLHWAAREGPLEIVQLLLDRGADLDASTKQGWTPLHYAALNGRIEITMLLADRGAHLDAVDKDGKTPLDVGIKHTAVASFLANKMLGTLLNQGKVDDAVKFYEEFPKLQKQNLGITLTSTIHRKLGEILYDQCRYSEALKVLNDVPPSESDSFSSILNNLRFKCTINTIKLLVIEGQIEYKDLQEVGKDIFGIQDANTFTQTEATECKNNSNCFVLFFRKNCSILFGTIFFWLLFTIVCLYAICCFQQ